MKQPLLELVCMIVVAALASPAQVSFRQLPVTGTTLPPVSLDSFVMWAYDAPQHYFVYSDLGTSGEVWEFANQTWSKLALTLQPTPRSGFAYSHQSGIFGGRTSANVYLNDAWYFFPGQKRWSQIIVGNATYPPARADAAFAVYYGLNLVFGGRNQSGVLGDCWRGVESTVAPYPWDWFAAPTGPSPRYDHRMVHSHLDYSVVLFGGRDANGNALDDTWIFTGNAAGGAWTQATPANKPPARSAHGMASDFLRRRIVIFGGLDKNLVPLNDTWEWTGTDWIPRAPSTPPAPRAFSSMTWDNQAQRSVLYGGSGTTELWSYGTDYPPSTVPVGTNCVPGVYGMNGLKTSGVGVPWVGGSVTLLASQFRPASAVSILLGTSTTSWLGYTLPLDLRTWLGRVCYLNQSIDVSVGMPATNGFVQLTVNVPNDPALAGFQIHAQAFGELVHDVGYYFWGTTNSMRVTVGLP